MTIVRRTMALWLWNPTWTVGVLMGALTPVVAHGQTLPTYHLSMVGGVVQYDLAGTGVVSALGVRGHRTLHPRLDLEVGSLFANPAQQFGRSTLVIPEAQLKLRLGRFGRVSPFVGGGGGAAFQSRSSGWDTRPTLSFTTGARVRVTDQLDVVGELRGRGIGRSFSASAAEWLGGLSYRFD